MFFKIIIYPKRFSQKIPELNCFFYKVSMPCEHIKTLYLPMHTTPLEIQPNLDKLSLILLVKCGLPNKNGTNFLGRIVDNLF
jgi:hypothetical protein